MNYTEREFNEAIQRHRQDERERAIWASVCSCVLGIIIGAGAMAFVLVIFNLE